MRKFGFLTVLGLSAAVLSPLGNAQPITVPGIGDRVELVYDIAGVPHIYANNEMDAAFVQGYVHARDRFFQMDYTRRAASGTVSELVGEAGLASDIELRTLGLRRAAWESYTALSSETRSLLQAYSNGVNFWLQNNDLPPEYGALELSGAAAWTPVDSVVVGKILALQLSFDLDINLTISLGTYQAVGDIVGFDGTALFFEDTHRSQPPDDSVTVPGFLDSIGGIGQESSVKSAKMHEGIAKVSPDVVAQLQSYRDRVADVALLQKPLNRIDSNVGSNWWAISGDNTTDGYPIFANDPHLALDLPAIWYEGHVVVDDGTPMSNIGVQLAGIPGIVLGCNDKSGGAAESAPYLDGYCWGATVNPTDVSDTFVDPVVLNSYGVPTHTVHNGQQEAIVWIFQSYYVNSIGDNELDNISRANIGYTNGGLTYIVPRRNNGPILDLDVANRTAITVQYTGWGPTLEIEAFHEINQGESLADFEQALTKFDVGTQNFGYADSDGNIAYFAASEVPVREDLQTLMAPDGGVPPFLIRDGSGALMHEWMPVQNPQPNQIVPYEILPANELPHVVNPDSGYIANANNDPIGTTLDNNPLNQLRPGGGIYYQNNGFASFRMARVDQELSDAFAAGEKVSRQDMRDLQANNELFDAQMVVPHILGAYLNATGADAWPGVAQFLLDPGVTEAIDRLAAWDFSTPTGLDTGYDPGDPFLPAPPTQSQIDNSVAATIFSTWRGQFMANTMDATLSAIGLGNVLPSSRIGYRAMIHHLETFDQANGVGASGISFFNIPDAPDAASARDFILLASLQQALELLASDEFAPAFANSTNQDDYRWGKLHRIVFEHPLGGPFNLPNGLYGLVPAGPGLDGIARSGGFEAVDASSHSARADGLNDFMFGAGPSRRFVGDMNPNTVLGLGQAIAGGQSGVLGSPAYASQLPFWLTNNYKLLAYLRPVHLNDATIAEIVEFEPVP
ncbi:MAG: hypothetical protein DHS20C11_02520 [Lysobacteraceae bacterium]|nr:MAG: hypothetical protein DHS20C11_02520 [Xanthomonadaceae bacterium]